MTPNEAALVSEARKLAVLLRLQTAVVGALVDRLGGDVLLTQQDLALPIALDSETTALGSYHLTTHLRLDNPDTPV
jgi:hypothetical protein